MRKSDRIYALAGTVAFHVVLLLVLLFSFLRFPPEGADEWPEEPRPEIVFEEMEELYAAGEFVRTGDNMAEYVPDDEPAPSDVSNPEPTQDAADAANAGKAADPAPALTSKQPSPAKTEQKPKGPTKEEIAAEKARQEAKKQQQTKKNVDAATARAFGGGKGATTAGSAEGNSATGSVTGTPGNGLKGRSLEKWTSVRGRKFGSKREGRLAGTRGQRHLQRRPQQRHRIGRRKHASPVCGPFERVPFLGARRLPRAVRHHHLDLQIAT